MEALTAKEVADKWGITVRQVQLLCARGKVPGATRFGNAWVIPANVQKPEDGRKKVEPSTKK